VEESSLQYQSPLSDHIPDIRLCTTKGRVRPRLCQNDEASIIFESQWWVKPNEAIH